jgi:hypothetical protein
MGFKMWGTAVWIEVGMTSVTETQVIFSRCSLPLEKEESVFRFRCQSVTDVKLIWGARVVRR